MVRTAVEDVQASKEDQQWLSNHQAATLAFYQQFASRTVEDDLNASSPELEREKEIRADAQRIVESMYVEEDSMWKCRRCNNAFSGKEYVEKHVKTIHKNIIEQQLLDVGRRVDA